MTEMELCTRAADACVEAARLFSVGRKTEAHGQLMKALYVSSQLRDRVRPNRVRKQLLGAK